VAHARHPASRRLTPRVVSGIRGRAGELSGAVGAAKGEVSVA